jgi:rod shape-determining protein MreD
VKGLLGFSLAGLGMLFLQSAVLPGFLQWQLKPDLLLILVVYLGFHERTIKAGAATYLLGLLQDTFAGTCLGLYGLVFLIIFLVVKAVSGRLNAESPLLLLFMVLCGTLLEAFILVFTLGFFAEAGRSWTIIASALPGQLLLNLTGAWILLKAGAWLEQRSRFRFLRPETSR